MFTKVKGMTEKIVVDISKSVTEITDNLNDIDKALWTLARLKAIELLLKYPVQRDARDKAWNSIPVDLDEFVRDVAIIDLPVE